jgi:hypothetical protein
MTFVRIAIQILVLTFQILFHKILMLEIIISYVFMILGMLWKYWEDILVACEISIFDWDF